jgi:hypothetical protein
MYHMITQTAYFNFYISYILIIKQRLLKLVLVFINLQLILFTLCIISRCSPFLGLSSSSNLLIHFINCFRPSQTKKNPFHSSILFVCLFVFYSSVNNFKNIKKKKKMFKFEFFFLKLLCVRFKTRTIVAWPIYSAQ